MTSRYKRELVYIHSTCFSFFFLSNPWETSECCRKRPVVLWCTYTWDELSGGKCDSRPEVKKCQKGEEERERDLFIPRFSSLSWRRMWEYFLTAPPRTRYIIQGVQVETEEERKKDEEGPGGNEENEEEKEKERKRLLRKRPSHEMKKEKTGLSSRLRLQRRINKSLLVCMEYNRHRKTLLSLPNGYIHMPPPPRGVHTPARSICGEAESSTSAQEAFKKPTQKDVHTWELYKSIDKNYKNKRKKIERENLSRRLSWTIGLQRRDKEVRIVMHAPCVLKKKKKENKKKKRERKTAGLVVYPFEKLKDSHIPKLSKERQLENRTFFLRETDR